MVSSVSNHGIENPSPISSPTAENQPKNDLLTKIWDVVKDIFYGLLCVAFFLITPVTFTIGFIVGIVFDDKVQEVVDKIKSIWKNNTWEMLLVTAVASFLVLEVTVATASFLFAANLGKDIAKKAMAKEQSEEPTTLDDIV